MIIVVGMVVTALEFVKRTPMVLVGLLFLALAVFFVVRIRANRKTKVIFSFYLAANEILVDAEGSRYRFEIADVIKTGEKVVRSMPDAPPLARFTLGALCYSVGNHSCAAEQLAMAAEEEVLKESEHASPSPQLRRYVKKLRKIERRPKRYAKLNAAIASLERMHQERAGRLLAESQNHLRRLVESADLPLKSITAAPTISEVLNEVYQ